MADYNYATFPTSPTPVTQTGTPMYTPQGPNMTGFNYPRQHSGPVQPQYFPPPQGNVYMIQSSPEVNNIPITNGLSAIVCLTDSTMFIKTIQNGNPTIMGYKLMPLDNQFVSTQPVSSTSEEPAKTKDLEEKITQVLKSFDERLKGIESSLSGKKGEAEWQI